MCIDTEISIGLNIFSLNIYLYPYIKTETVQVYVSMGLLLPCQKKKMCRNKTRRLSPVRENLN